MSEIAEAAQVFVVAIQGIEVAFKIAEKTIEFSLKVLQGVVGFLDAMLRHEKFCGETSIETMLKNGDDIEACQIPQNKLSQFKKLAKKYGILYSVVPGGKNGTADILFRADDIKRMNMLFEKMKLGEVQKQSVTEFAKDISKERMDEIEKESIPPEDIEVMDSMEEEKSVDMLGIGKKDVYVDEEHKNRMEEVLQEMQEKYAKGEQVDMGKFDRAAMDIQMNVLSNHPGYEKIGIVTKNSDGYPLLVDETPDKIKVRIPYETNKFIWLDKKEAFLSEDRSHITAFLKRDRDYVIVDKVNWEVERKLGSRMYKEHYDPSFVRNKNRINTRKQNINLNKKVKQKEKTASVR